MRQLLTSTLIIVTVFFQAQAQTVKKIGTGTSFTCLSYDAEGNLWAGTMSKGLWKAKGDSAAGTIKEGSLTLFSTDENFNKYQLQTIATPTINGRTTVLVGSRGLGYGSASGGGLHQFLTTTTTKPYTFIAERDEITAKAMKLPKRKNDGTPTRNCRAVTADKYGTIWSAHGYHDLTTTGYLTEEYDPIIRMMVPKYIPGGYYLTPGGLGRKPSDKSQFDNVANPDMPYPAYTVDNNTTYSPGTRQCISIAAANDQMWMGFQTYTIGGENAVYGGIAIYSLAGKLVDKIDYSTTTELPFQKSFSTPVPVAIHFQKFGDPWLAFSHRKGFAYKKDFTYSTAKWVYVDKLMHYNKATEEQEVSTLFTDGIPVFDFNPHAITSIGRKVFLGTTTGLLVYDGFGDARQDSSYTFITTENGLSSNNIKAITPGVGCVYVATDAGVDQVTLPSELVILHIDEKTKPFESDNQNYIEMSTMASLKGMNNISFENDDLPMFSADGTTSSVFRFYTDDFDGFYQQEKKYLFGLSAEYYNEDTAKYGKFTLKPLEYYEDDKKEYVDIIYRHPLNVDEAFVSQGKDAKYDFTIAKKNALSEPIFKNYVKITTPPVLLVHGVWSNISSLVKIEEALQKQENYKDFKVLKIYKLHEDEGGNTAEKPFAGDAHEIPDGIKRLIASCSANNLSAGKASLVVHSRGGLYSRAYIEELQPGIKYNFDVHSLITLNTPHSGSQLANLVLDERKVAVSEIDGFAGLSPMGDPMYSYKIVEKNLGDFFAVLAVPPGDLGPKNGAKVLMVDKGFITELNSEKNLATLKKHGVPIHAVATEFKFCKLSVTDCDRPGIFKNPALKTAPKLLSRLNIALGLYELLLVDAPKGIDAFLKYIFNGENSDAIVPRSSMEAGLPYPYITTMHELNLAHIDLGSTVKKIGGEGVTASDAIHNRIIELLGQNVYSSTSNFSKGELNPPRGATKLEYHFWDSYKKNKENTRKARTAEGELTDEYNFYINRKDSLTTYKNGDTLTINLVTEGLERGMISVQSEDETVPVVEIFSTLADSNFLTYLIPENYFGNIIVSAYGVKGEDLIVMDTRIYVIDKPESISLKNIHFNSHSEVIEMEQMNMYDFELIASYTDSIHKIITNNPEVNYYFTDTSIVKFENGLQVTALNQGRSYLIAVYEDKIDSLQFIVYENPHLKETVIGDFYVSVTDDNELIFDWNTLQEYRTESIVVEQSENGIDFSELFKVAAAGTSYEQTNYLFKDEFTAHTKMYYRLRIVDSLASVNLLSQVREVLPSGDIEVAVDKVDFDKYDFNIYPNPNKGGNISITYSALTATSSAQVLIKNLQGELIKASNITLHQGENTINVDFPSFITPGVYVVQLNTVAESYSKKVIITK